jgi:lysophospholipase L1-like esterase
MKISIKKICIASLLVNLVFVIVASMFFAKGYYRKIYKPYLRDYYQNRVSLFRSLNKTGARIFFIGDSLTDRCEWDELLDRNDAANRGIEADSTDGVLNRLDEVTARRPAKIFIMIGGIDFVLGRKVPEIMKNYREILARIRTESPRTKIYIQSIIPTYYRLVPLPRHLIRDLNATLKTLADGVNVFYLDIYSRMADKNGDLKSSFTIDGVHLNGPGYRAWRDVIADSLK